jgi:hypothetical protein
MEANMRVIAIQSQAKATEGSACENEESGWVRKVNLPLVRREFLKGSGILMGTLASGSLLSALAPSTAWALELKTLTTSEGSTLMAFGRSLFPHPSLPDAVYALLAKDLDAAASQNAATLKTLQMGVAQINLEANGSFAKANVQKRQQIVQQLQRTDFFALVRGQCITSLYNNDMAFTAFGYPGSAWEKGGYLTRGFQDLKWLKPPSKEDSPDPFVG